MSDSPKQNRPSGLAVLRARRKLFRILEVESAANEAERMQVERERDRLIELAARAEMWREDSPFYTNERFIAWLARDLRERAEFCGSVDEALIRRVTDQVYTRVQAARLGVKDGGRSPSSQPVPTSTTLAALVDGAAGGRYAPRSDLSIAAGAGRALWDEPCDAVVPLPPDVPSGRYVALRVAGDSMTPLIHSGDLVLVRLGADVKCDTLIVARGPDDGYVLKHVGGLSRRRIELRSLNPEYMPIAIPRDSSRVLGTAILRWCDHEDASRRP